MVCCKVSIAIYFPFMTLQELWLLKYPFAAVVLIYITQQEYGRRKPHGVATTGSYNMSIA